MNSKIQFIALGAAVLALGACSSDNDELQQAEASKYITVSTEIGAMSRVATTGNESVFENGDKISVYAWTGDKETAPAADARVVDNSINTLTDGKWTPTPQMLWKDMVTPHYFIGVYPHIEQGKGLDTDLTKFAYELTTTNQTVSDLLVAVNTTGMKATDAVTTVPLEFTHVMAKVVINLSFRNQWTEGNAEENTRPEVSSAAICNVASNATVNLLTKAVTPASDKKDITIPQVVENTSYSSIFIPQSDVRQVAIVIGDKTYTFTNNEDISFASGKITTINLIVGRNKIELDGVTIAPWEVGATIDSGEAQEE